MTLGAKFISRCLAEHVVPVRKGTRRGDPVGMHRLKYTSAVLDAVYGLTTVELETVTGASRALVSKWRTEKRYSDTVTMIKGMFIEEICGGVTKGADAGGFRDARYFALAVKREIIARCQAAYDGNDADELFRLWPLMSHICMV